MSRSTSKGIVCALFFVLAGAGCGDDGSSEGANGAGRDDGGSSSDGASDAGRDDGGSNGDGASDAGRDSGAAPGNGGDATVGDAALPAGEVTFKMLYDEVFSDSISCSSFYCHAGGGQGLTMTGLDMSKKDALYDLLVNKDASANCSGWKRVVPGNPDKSLLLQKLGGSPPCGERMPKDMGALSAVQIARIRRWIQDGAKND